MSYTRVEGPIERPPLAEVEVGWEGAYRTTGPLRESRVVGARSGDEVGDVATCVGCGEALRTLGEEGEERDVDGEE